ncbi:hypothetical protein [Photobacterium ganghwense]|uniref:hypothetical protein n=1 Tax=Photobacterium ganghwense TaxID=320778 RepID=UPI001A8CBC12|nr:hypothetical protein [Photobacterium ganghwense]QSV17578.1 hypothetical protein FH974_26105 [Photobacterium ganghwense]
MMALTLVSKKISDNTARVFWRVGTKRTGIVDVCFSFKSDEVASLAELVVCRELIFNRKILNSEPPVSGQGIKLVFSAGATKKHFLQRSTSITGKKLAKFVGHRLADAKLVVSKDMEFMADEVSTAIERIDVNPEDYYSTNTEIDTPAIGRLNVTLHAIDQYEERVTGGKPLKGWASLKKRLENTELCQRKLPPKVLEHKARKYGRADNIEVWAHPSSTLHFLCLVDEGVKTLVTCFERE